MASDTEIVLLFGGLHLVALACACVMFWMFLKADTVEPWEPTDDEDGSGGGGGSDRLGDPPRSPGPGGVPLPDAEPSHVRLRGAGRIADAYDAPRRPHRAPERTPERV